MPIIVALAVLGALIYGAFWSFHALSSAFGLSVAIGAAVVAAALLLFAIGWWIKRMRDVAANIHDGDWTHELKGTWGFVRLAAGKRLCRIDVAAQRGDFIFADLVSARAEARGNAWCVVVSVRNAKQDMWVLPVGSSRVAKQWERILSLAIRQKL
ncbi:hypothetical protein [Paraburkholderia sp.]|uniref:hypothetical protein n=1 Tax=Paraburkholderia sp. TaxID=1926495 RepID=UPI0023880DBF|nr:hypothetical protein [Paraburkholderia sp.]MDE1184583.1 hypothetical protein [Paraburkholderia sp.]